MIRHTVLFSWKPDATDEQKQRAATELGKLPSIVPVGARVRSKDLSVRTGGGITKGT